MLSVRRYNLVKMMRLHSYGSQSLSVRGTTPACVSRLYYCAINGEWFLKNKRCAQSQLATCETRQGSLGKTNC